MAQILLAIRDLFFFNTNTRKGLRKFNSLIFVILCIVYLYCFWIPIEISSWDNSINLYTIIAIVFFYVVPVITEKIIFEGDPLQFDKTGKNPYSVFFQQQFPSRHIMQKYNIQESQANTYWFGIFNKWRAGGEPHATWARLSLQRGYTCKTIYYLFIKWFFRFFLLSILSLLGIIIFHQFSTAPSPTDLSSLTAIDRILPMFIFTLSMFIIYLYVKYSNRIKGNSPTGVWQKWKEINDINKVWLDDNASSINDLQALSK